MCLSCSTRCASRKAGTMCLLSCSSGVPVVRHGVCLSCITKCAHYVALGVPLLCSCCVESRVPFVWPLNMTVVRHAFCLRVTPGAPVVCDTQCVRHVLSRDWELIWGCWNGQFFYIRMHIRTYMIEWPAFLITFKHAHIWLAFASSAGFANRLADL